MGRGRRHTPPKGVPYCDERRAKRAEPPAWGKAAHLLLSRAPRDWKLAVLNRRLYLMSAELWHACRADPACLSAAPEDSFVDLGKIWVF
jgi:hypothetical protein